MKAGYRDDEDTKHHQPQRYLDILISRGHLWHDPKVNRMELAYLETHRFFTEHWA